MWTAEVPVDAGFYEFKCVVYNMETNSVSRWEDGANRILNIPKEPGSWEVNCAWGLTSDMTQAFTPAPPPPPPPPAPAAAAAAVAEEAPAANAKAQEAATSAEESLPAFMALSDEASRTEEGKEAGAGVSTSGVAADTAPGAAVAVAADASSAAALEVPDASGASGGGGAVAFLLATCAAGAVAAAAVLSPGGLDATALGGLGGRASELLNTTILQSTLAGSQVRSQVATQLSAVQARVAAVSPAVQAGVASVQAGVAAVSPAVRAGVASVQGSVAEGLSSLEPMVRSGAAAVQGQASVMTARASAAVTDAASDLLDAGLAPARGRQG